MSNASLADTVSPNILTAISEAVLDRLKAKGLNVDQFAFNDLRTGVLNLRTPAVNVIIDQARSQKVTQTTWKQIVTMSLILIVKNVKGATTGDAQRRSKIYELLDGIGRYLQFQDLSESLEPQGLALENPLMIDGWRNVTTREWAKAAYQVFDMKFWCSYNVEYSSDMPDLGNLTSIMAEFSIEPEATGSEPPQTASLIPLTV